MDGAKLSSLATPRLYWLSISFPAWFKDAADAALEFGLRLHGFFEGRLDPAQRRSVTCEGQTSTNRIMWNRFGRLKPAP